MEGVEEYWAAIPEESRIVGRWILVLGAGSVASHVAVKCAAAGASMIFVDGDTYARRNIPRHTLPAAYVGHNKADALAQWLSGYTESEFISVPAFVEDIDPQVLGELVEKVELVVLCTANAAADRLLTDMAHTIGVPVVRVRMFPHEEEGLGDVQWFINGWPGECIKCGGSEVGGLSGELGSLVDVERVAVEAVDQIVNYLHRDLDLLKELAQGRARTIVAPRAIGTVRPVPDPRCDGEHGGVVFPFDHRLLSLRIAVRQLLVAVKSTGAGWR